MSNFKTVSSETATRAVFARLPAWVTSLLNVDPAVAIRRATETELSALDDQALADIGIARGDIPSIATSVAAGEVHRRR